MGISNLLFGFKGRITRSQYWLGGLAPVFIFIVLIFCVTTSLVGMAPNGLGDPIVIMKLLGKLFLPVCLGLCACVWISAALFTKRLHDRDKGAIWLLAIYVPAFLPFLSFIFAPDLITASGIVVTISNLWVTIELGSMRGTEGSNRFDRDLTGTMLDDAFGKKPATFHAEENHSLGGMEAAMAAINAASRAMPATLAQTTHRADGQQPFGSPGTGSFGRKIVPQAHSGFGLRRL